MDLELNEQIVDEVMKLENNNTISIFNSLLMVRKYAVVDLLHDDKNNLFYSCKLKDILSSDMSVGELINLRNGGWELSDNKQFLIKKL